MSSSPLRLVATAVLLIASHSSWSDSTRFLSLGGNPGGQRWWQAKQVVTQLKRLRGSALADGNHQSATLEAMDRAHYAWQHNLFTDVNVLRAGATSLWIPLGNGQGVRLTTDPLRYAGHHFGV